MSEPEFLILDELYFLQSFDELQHLTGLSVAELQQTLHALVQKGWVKCLLSREGEEPASQAEFSSRYASLFYLATKAGLMAHNSR
jgi:hypothetical protein